MKYALIFGLLAVFAEVIASVDVADIRFGTASREFITDGYLYRIPIDVNNGDDIYSSVRASLSGNQSFLSGVESRLIHEGGEVVLTFITPRHIEVQKVIVAIDYFGKRTERSYRLEPPPHARERALALGRGCRKQWILKGTLLSNIDRIFRLCGWSLGEWPISSPGHYSDFKIHREHRLAGRGDLESLLLYISKHFGLVGVKASQTPGGLINFSDSEGKL